MNRLSFLKKLGIGVAAGVIAPTIIKDIVITPHLKDGVTIDTDLLPININPVELARDYHLRYARMAYQWNVQGKPFFWDVCIDRDGREWVCVPPFEDGQIKLCAVNPKPIPDTIMVKEENFKDYFLIRTNKKKEL